MRVFTTLIVSCLLLGFAWVLCAGARLASRFGGFFCCIYELSIRRFLSFYLGLDEVWFVEAARGCCRTQGRGDFGDMV